MATQQTISPPDVIITGGLITVFSVAGGSSPQPEFGSLDVALCGYGSYVPEIEGAKISLITQSVTMQPPTDANPGKFEILLYSNPLITPAGTYYTFTVKDANGDIVQCEAYAILSSGQYDITQLTPFDPTQPPAPLPPQILNLLLVVPYDPNAQFPGDQFTSWQITLAGDCSPTFVNLVNGNLYTIIILQDGAGHHAFNWPSNVHNASSIYQIPNGRTVQTFVAVDSVLYPIGVATWQ